MKEVRKERKVAKDGSGSRERKRESRGGAGDAGDRGESSPKKLYENKPTDRAGIDRLTAKLEDLRNVAKELQRESAEGMSAERRAEVLAERLKGKEILLGGAPLPVLAVDQVPAGIGQLGLAVTLGGVAVPFLAGFFGAAGADCWHDLKGCWVTRAKPFERCEHALRKVVASPALGDWRLEAVILKDDQESTLRLDRNIPLEELTVAKNLRFEALPVPFNVCWSLARRSWEANTDRAEGDVRVWISNCWVPAQP